MKKVKIISENNNSMAVEVVDSEAMSQFRKCLEEIGDKLNHCIALKHMCHYVNHDERIKKIGYSVEANGFNLIQQAVTWQFIQSIRNLVDQTRDVYSFHWAFEYVNDIDEEEFYCVEKIKKAQKKWEKTKGGCRLQSIHRFRHKVIAHNALPADNKIRKLKYGDAEKVLEEFLEINELLNCGAMYGNQITKMMDKDWEYYSEKFFNKFFKSFESSSV